LPPSKTPSKSKDAEYVIGHVVPSQHDRRRRCARYYDASPRDEGTSIKRNQQARTNDQLLVNAVQVAIAEIRPTQLRRASRAAAIKRRRFARRASRNPGQWPV
jgi:hypothetical protein